MSSGLLEYIIVGVIISVTVNIIIMRIRHLMEIIRNRNSNNNSNGIDIPPHVWGGTQSSRPSTPPSLPTNGQSATESDTASNQVGNNGRPSLPRRTTTVRRGPDTFPRCPVCRCRNRQGQQQMIFWNNQTRQWRCHNGHQFSS